MENTFIDKFTKGLKKYNLTFNDVKTQYKYIGGNNGSHLRYYLLVNNIKPNTIFNLPKKQKKCICGHDIKHNSYIQDINNKNNIIVLGSCCIKRFIDKKGRTCQTCLKPHKNLKDNYCSSCRPLKPMNNDCFKCGIYCGDSIQCLKCSYLL